MNRDNRRCFARYDNREKSMVETAWWHALDKKRGSRPRCVLLVDGTRYAVAARLTDLVDLSDVVVSPNECWMPRGKPVWTDKGWDKKPATETRLDRETGFVAPEIRQQLLEWWLEVVRGANTPNWDLASTCSIEGRKGLLLVEAKSHSHELEKEGKRNPSTENGWKNHERIGSAIRQANAGLRRVAGGSWGLSRDDRYQFSNRFAWSWKLAALGVPVVLMYLGFVNSEEMARDGALFRTEDDWAHAMKDHTRGVVDNSCWGRRLEVNGTPFRPLIRAIDVPFTPDL